VTIQAHLCSFSCNPQVIGIKANRDHKSACTQKCVSLEGNVQYWSARHGISLE
jgi:hypothetical protein